MRVASYLLAAVTGLSALAGSSDMADRTSDTARAGVNAAEALAAFSRAAEMGTRARCPVVDRAIEARLREAGGPFTFVDTGSTACDGPDGPPPQHCPPGTTIHLEVKPCIDDLCDPPDSEDASRTPPDYRRFIVVSARCQVYSL